MGSIAAILVAIGLGEIQARRTLKAERARLMPYVLMNCETDYNAGTSSVSITNHGLGPVVVMDFDIIFEGEVVDFSVIRWDELLAQISIHYGGGMTMDHGTVLGSGTTLELFKCRFKPVAGDETKVTDRRLEKIDMRMSYSSVFGEPPKTVTLRRGART